MITEMNAPSGVYSPSPLKRRRRTDDELSRLLAGVHQELKQHDGAITIRHLFYRLVSAKLLEKTETAYKTLIAHLSKWRRSGEVPWSAFADSTRWRIGRTLHEGPLSALENTVACYRKNLWQEQPFYVELWTEKDAIASILSDVADGFGVSVFVCRGFSSLSSLYSGANLFRNMQEQGKAVHVAYFGDHDPSGKHIDRSAMETLRRDFGIEISLERVAVTPPQIEEYNLPTRPVKAGDSRAKDWVGGCVEVDAMPMPLLRNLASNAITRHIEPHAWAELQRVEVAERGSLMELVEAWKGGAN